MFVERSRQALAGIRHNLEVTGLAARADVVARDVFTYLRDSPSPFDVIFVAPPQWQGLWPRAVALLDREPGWLADGAVVVVQHDPAESTPLELDYLHLADERTYGRVRFTFFEAGLAVGTALQDDQQIMLGMLGWVVNLPGRWALYWSVRRAQAGAGPGSAGRCAWF